MKQIHPAVSDAHLQAAARLWDYLSLFDALEPADAIVGLGSHDIRVAERCAELYHQGLAPTLLFTGHEGRFTRGLFGQTEAEAFAAAARKASVPDTAMLLEHRATNTGENIRFTAEMLPRNSRVIFVAKPHMQRRCRATVALSWPEAAETARYTAPLHGLAGQPTRHRSMPQIISEITGTLHRMLSYPALGFQAPDPVPDGVLEAYKYLVTEGYTEDLPA